MTIVMVAELLRCNALLPQNQANWRRNPAKYAIEIA